MSAGVRLRAALAGLWAAPWRLSLKPPPPAAGLEVRADGLRWRDRRGDAGAAPLPEAVNRLDGLHLNAADEKALAAALAAALAPLPEGPLALLLPARHFQAFFLPLDTTPRTRREADELLRFRLKRLLPYKPESARLAFRPLAAGRPGLFALAAYEPVLRQWEAALAACARPAGWLLPAPFAALAAWNRAEPPAAGETRLLVEEDDAGVTLVASCGGAPVALRARPRLPEETASGLAAREAVLTAAFLREKVGLSAPAAAAARLALPADEPLLAALRGEGGARVGSAPEPLDWIAPARAEAAA